MGVHPCVFTEIGIPYDMDDKYAYKTGDYTSQTLALDANHYAIEGSNVAGYTLWVYTATNNHYRGDNWNGEDLSIFSVDDNTLPLSPHSTNVSTTSVDRTSPSYSDGRLSGSPNVSPATLKKTLSVDQMSANRSPSVDGDNPGFRAAESYVRPTPIATHGDVLSFGFDLRSCTFTLSLNAPSSTEDNTPTEIFLPEFHFPATDTTVEVTGGKWSISIDSADGGLQQRLRWWHAAGEQKLTAKGVRRRQGMALGKEEDDGYLEQCRQKACAVM